jgi:uncharacterized repeat protein (TIGR01451 family)
MTEQEDTRRKSRRDLLLVLLILPLGVLCMFVTGQAAIRLAPTWVLNADMRSLLDPNAQFAAGGNQLFIEPLDPGILTLPAWSDLFLTPNAAIPTRLIPTATPPPPARTPQPPTVRNTPDVEPTATVVGPIILPTRPGPSLADLVIGLSDNSQTYTPGAPITYTILVSNLGPDDAPRFNVIDNIPAVISGLTVTCTPAALCGTNTSSGNTVSFTGANLPSSGVNQITISVSGTVASGATGNLSNTASIVIPNNARYQDPNLSNNTVTDTDTQRSVYELAITKSDGVNTYTAITPITYTIVVTNNVGPSDALSVRVTDSKPPQIASWTWTCTTVTNASGCNGVTNSTNNFTDTVNVRVGGRIEYSVTANLSILNQNPQSLSNTANILLPGGSGFVDPNLGNNSATDVNIPFIDLQITKTDGGASYTAGGTVPYTVTVTNNSTFNLTGITLSDPKPPQVTTWSWTCASGCTPVNNSSSNFTDTIDLTAGSSLVYNVTANISGTAGTGNITNTATVSAPVGLIDANPANNSATDVTPLYIDLQIAKTDGVDTYTPGGVVNYTVIVTNNSPVTLNGVTVTDAMPALISSWTWTCTPGPGASCTLGPGNTNINDSVVNLPAGGSVTYTIEAIVNDFAAGTLENTATVNPPTGFVDAVPGNNTATDSNVSAVGEPDIGPPDGNIYIIPDGGTATFFMSQPIIANGDPAADFVFYELPMGPGINLDQVIIEISAEGSNWYRVFFWGDTIADTNTNVDNVNIPNIASACPTETDNCPIASGDLYNNTGIRIDVDNSPLSPGLPQGNYYWIRFTEPNLPTSDNDDAHVDAIEILP